MATTSQPRLTVDGQIEHGKVATAGINLEFRPDRPDVFGPQRRLRPGQHEVVRLNPWKKSGLAQRHRVLVGCADASMRYHDEIRVFSRLMAKSVVGNNQ